MAKENKLILGVSGSIAAYKSADILRLLQEKGFQVSVVMTKDAEKFITPLTLSSLAGEMVYRSSIEDNADSWEMVHIRLAEEAQALVIAPATANIIAKLACGIADDLLTCIALGTHARIFIAPAMNTEMYNNKIVQENCTKLKNLGFHFINPIKGKLACGVTGEGHLADVKTIADTIEKHLK